MRYLNFLLFSLILVTGEAQNDSLNMTKLGGWQDATPGTYYNDIWGYASAGREYAIIGSNHATYFIDVTDDTPVVVDSFSGNDLDVIWRDYKVYDHYAYGVADGGNNSLQIFDLAYLPDSVVKVYDSQEFTTSTHNIFIEQDRLYMCLNTRLSGSSYALDVLSLTNPVQPTLIKNVPSSYFGNSGVHDIYVKNDTAYCSAEYSGMFIMDLTDLNNPQTISSINFYVDQGYNHSSWVSEDGKTMVMADEVPSGLALKLFDVSDVTDPVYLTKFSSNPSARPHNVFFRGNNIFVSYYLDGVQVFNAADPMNPVKTAFYDTYPDNGTAYPTDSYDGCWGVYPYLPSGKIIASDGSYGLFVLSSPTLLSVEESSFDNGPTIEVYPNPVSDRMVVRSNQSFVKVTITNALGQIVFENEQQNAYISEINVSALEKGLYAVTVVGSAGVTTRKVLIHGGLN